MLRGEAGFAEPLNLAARPSLYWTSWSLRLAAELGESRPTMQGSRIRAYLASSFVRPSAEDEQMTPLMRVSLVTGALAALPRGITPEERAHAEKLVEGFRQGSEYAWSPAGRPDPAATMVAVAALRDAGLAVPRPVVSDVRRAADRLVLADVADQEITTLGIPRVVARVLAGDKVGADERADITALIDAWRERVISQGAGAVQISALYWLDVVGTHIGSPSSDLPADWLDGHITPAGYVEAQPGAGGDAQTTFYAAHLGAVDIDDVARGLERRFGERGWVATFSQIDLAATSHIVSALSLCGGLDGVDFPTAALPRPDQVADGIDPRSAGQVCSIVAAFPQEAREWGSENAIDCESTAKDLRSWWSAQSGANILGSGLNAPHDASAFDNFCREDVCWFLGGGEFSDRDVYSTAIHATLEGFDAARRSRLLLEFAHGNSYSTNPRGAAAHQVDSLTLLGVALLAAPGQASWNTLVIV